MSRYLVIIEESDTGYSAFLPDIPGCIVTGATREEVENEIREGVSISRPFASPANGCHHLGRQQPT